ncbi:hypothetical protein, partial [Thermogladius sp.]|uniref:hypothetical protein n=1 Tax=Thermogladius sp. TaxID=2023064 RepID=UPI003D105D9A
TNPLNTTAVRPFSILPRSLNAFSQMLNQGVHRARSSRERREAIKGETRIKGLASTEDTEFLFDRGSLK